MPKRSAALTAAASARLTAKQQAFVREYLVDLNATQAAIRAGYSVRSASRIGAELLQKTQVAAAIAAAKTERAARTEVTQDWVIQRLVSNVERAMQAEPVYDREGNQTGEYTYAGSVANRALELLGKHVGMFTERLDVTSAGKALAWFEPPHGEAESG